jgi:hypothetical protein
MTLPGGTASAARVVVLAGGLSGLAGVAGCGPREAPPEAPPGSVPVDIEARRKHSGPIFLEPEPEPAPGRPSPVGPASPVSPVGPASPSGPAPAQGDSEGKHPATMAECKQVTDKAVELTLKKEGIDASAMGEARAAVKEALGDKMKTDCQGRPISDGALRCARSASSMAELEQCLR